MRGSVFDADMFLRWYQKRPMDSEKKYMQAYVFFQWIMYYFFLPSLLLRFTCSARPREIRQLYRDTAYIRIQRSWCVLRLVYTIWTRIRISTFPNAILLFGIYFVLQRMFAFNSMLFSPLWAQVKLDASFCALMQITSSPVFAVYAWTITTVNPFFCWLPMSHDEAVFRSLHK
jgi:hypothetical protein